MQPGEIICHADHGPWNYVYRDGRPFALIDWDSCRPDTQILDLAQAAWNFVPLVDEGVGQELGFAEIDYGKRLRIFLDAYRLDDRSIFREALVERKQRDAELTRFWGLGDEDRAAFVREIDQEVAWLATLGAGLVS